MTFDTCRLAWDKFTQSSRQRLLVGGTALAVSVTAGLAAIGIAHGADPTTRQTLQASGIEVSEDANSYTVKLPKSDEKGVMVRMEGQTLRIGSKKAANGVRLEQSLALPDADDTQPLQISQENGQVAIVVTKSSSPTPRATAQNPTRHRQLSPVDPSLVMGGSPQDVMDQFQQMQQQMDKLFAQATGGSTGASPLAGLAGMGGSGMGVDIQEKGNDYVVRAKVPADATKNLKVAVDNDRVLKITAQNEDTAANQYQSSNFTQVFTLPGPVQSGKMKVENENGDVVITLPKA